MLERDLFCGSLSGRRALAAKQGILGSELLAERDRSRQAGFANGHRGFRYGDKKTYQAFASSAGTLGLALGFFVQGTS